MEPIKNLSVYDLPDRKHEPDGYDLKTVPDMSAKNIEIMIDKINEIIEVVNQLLPPG